MEIDFPEKTTKTAAKAAFKYSSGMSPSLERYYNAVIGGEEALVKYYLAEFEAQLKMENFSSIIVNSILGDLAKNTVLGVRTICQKIKKAIADSIIEYYHDVPQLEKFLTHKWNVEKNQLATGEEIELINDTLQNIIDNIRKRFDL
jgi:hypothetical protein